MFKLVLRYLLRQKRVKCDYIVEENVCIKTEKLIMAKFLEPKKKKDIKYIAANNR